MGYTGGYSRVTDFIRAWRAGAGAATAVKGVVEKNVQESRRRIWSDAANQRFSSFAELNVWLAERCRALWQEVQEQADTAEEREGETEPF